MRRLGYTFGIAFAMSFLLSQTALRGMDWWVTFAAFWVIAFVVRRVPLLVGD